MSSGVFFVNFEHIPHFVLTFLLTLNMSLRAGTLHEKFEFEVFSGPNTRKNGPLKLRINTLPFVTVFADQQRLAQFYF